MNFFKIGVHKMYGVIFELKKEDPKSYQDVQEMYQQIFKSFNFEQVQENFYITNKEENVLTTLYKLIKTLSELNFFMDVITNVRAFKIEELSDFTDIVKNGF